MRKSISICIPCYEMHGKGVEYLAHSLHAISRQTHLDGVDIVLSDHSYNDDIENVAKKWAEVLPITYIRKTYARDNPSSNLNLAIQNCEGDYIKILFLDDFLYCEDAIEKMIATIDKNPEAAWFVSACQHYDGSSFYSEHQPSLNNPELLIDGNNSLGSPSIVWFRNEKENIPFGREYQWLMDCQWYYKMYKKHGLPVFVPDVLVAIRTGAHQLTATLTDEEKQNEHEHLKQQHTK